MPRTLTALALSLAASTGLAGQDWLVVDGKRDLPPLESWAATQRALFVDFDADGTLDVVCGREGIGWPQPLVFRGLGAGRFAAVAADPGVWLPLRAAADLDRDGLVELVLDAEPLTQLGPDGRLRTSSARLGTGPAAVGDVDGDGDLDVVRAPPGGLEIWLQIAPLTFRQGHSPPGSGGVAVALNDFEGDGDLDVLVARRGAADGLWLGEGNGHFLVADQRMPSVVRATLDCVFRDLDGDGACDVMFLDGAREGGRLLLQRGGVLVDHSARLGLPGGPHIDVVAGDVDSDGRVDLVVASDPGGVVLRGVGGGWFLPVAGAFPSARSNSSLDLGDLDGDGDLDLLEASQDATARIHLGDGRGHFVGPSSRHQRLPVTPPMAETYLALGDFDGDGDPDVVTPGRFWRNDGFGTFLLQPCDAPRGAASPVWSSLCTVAVGDVDGDGHLDLVVPTGSDRFQVHHGRGDGRFLPGLGFRAPIGPPAHPWEAPQFVGMLALHDLDADGALDLVCGAMRSDLQRPAAPARDSVWRGDGLGGFVEDPTALPAGAEIGNHIAFGDLDGDGRADFSDGRASFLQRSDGSFTVVEPDPAGVLDSFYRIDVALADLDADGDLDAVCATGCLGTPWCEGEPDLIGWNDGQGRLTRHPASTLDEESAGVAVLDVDADGTRDLLFVRKDLGAHGRAWDQIQRNDGHGGFTADDFCGPWRDTWVVRCADLDGDGDRDVLTLDRSPGAGGGEPLVIPRWNLARHLLAPDLLRIGSAFKLELHGGVGGGALLMSPRTARITVPPFGVLGLAPETTAVLASFGPPAAGRVHRHTLVCPGDPALLGLRIGFQGLTVGPRDDLRLTNRIVERFGWR